MLSLGKNAHQKLSMGLCKSSDIFQDKMNESFDGLEYVRANIDDLLIISNVNAEDHINKVITGF